MEASKAGNVRDLREAREAEGLDPDRGGASISQRAAANGSIEASDQRGLFDREVENNALLQALEARESKKGALSTAKNNFKNADDRAKALIGELDLQEDEVVRVGRFKLSKSVIPGGHRSFDVGGQERLNIGVIRD